jgi:hypothetical protein
MQVKAKRRKEFLLLVAIPALIALLDGVIIALKFYPELVWIPSVVIFIWPVHLLTEKFSSEDSELSFLQSRRAALYLVQLLVIVPINAILFLTGNSDAILGPPLVGVFLRVITPLFMGGREEVRLFELPQRELYNKMAAEASVATIWLASTLAVVDFFIYLGLPILLIGFGIPIAAIFGYMAYRNESKSVQFEFQLVASLRKSRWMQKRKFKEKREAAKAKK